MDIVLSRAVNRTGEVRMVKVPEHLYQDFFTMAQAYDREYAKKAIFAKLNQWLENNYPDYGLINFEDYNKSDAEAINIQLAEAGKQYRITWGMYLIIGRGVESHLSSVPVIGFITEPQKHIER